MGNIKKQMVKKKLYDEGCPCNTCKFSKGYKQGCISSLTSGCDVLFEWFYPGSILNPKCPGEH